MTSKIKVDNINKVSDDSNIIKKCGTTITLGASGDSIALASGASQTGFGRTGTVDWQTGSIKTATFTAVNGQGFFANTSGGAFVMNLPAGTAGNIVSVVDYTNTFQTNALTITPNGSQKIGGVAASIDLNTEGQSVTFVYVDDTEGWKNTMDSTSNITGNPFLVATGGTITTSGNFKIHKFTGPGTFTVSSTAICAPLNNVDYLVVAGGGSGGTGSNGDAGGGGGAGGARMSSGVASGCYSASPLGSGVSALPVSVQGYSITVGGGGAGSTIPAPSPTTNPGNRGSNSTFSTITSTGGGAGQQRTTTTPTGPGGSGGGGGRGNTSTTFTGNTPPVSPSQGNNGGLAQAFPARVGGGGGGASAVGGTGSGGAAGAGGAGISNSITASPVAYAGGGGGAGIPIDVPGTPGAGGTGGGGAGGGNPGSSGTAGTVNTGGGSGGGSAAVGEFFASNAGGSGIVIIRYKFQ